MHISGLINIFRVICEISQKMLISPEIRVLAPKKVHFLITTQKHTEFFFHFFSPNFVDTRWATLYGLVARISSNTRWFNLTVNELLYSQVSNDGAHLTVYERNFNFYRIFLYVRPFPSFFFHFEAGNKFS